MVPFHHGFGPLQARRARSMGITLSFRPCLRVCWAFRRKKARSMPGPYLSWTGSGLSSQYEPLGSYGIGLKQAAQSVLLFSNRLMPYFKGVCAVTDETSTSFRLLQILLEARFGLSGIKYGRIASSMLFDGAADGLLLIGDEALKAKREGVPGFPFITDLGEEWYKWQGQVPFVLPTLGCASRIRSVKKLN